MEKEFLEDLADILEVEAEEISMETDFRTDVDDFDSLKGYSMLILFEDDYKTKMSVEEFLNCKTIGDLFQFVSK